MRALKKSEFCLLCFLVFLLSGAITCAFRTKYRYLPAATADIALSYCGLVQEYSFLQYRQAGPDQAKAALLEYVEMFHKLQTEQANFSPRRMHFELGVTNMRLYRLELAADDPTEAANYFSSAQSEFSTAGMKDVSADKLKKAAETADANEAKYYNAVEAVTKPKVEQESATSSKVSR